MKYIFEHIIIPLLAFGISIAVLYEIPKIFGEGYGAMRLELLRRKEDLAHFHPSMTPFMMVVMLLAAVSVIAFCVSFGYGLVQLITKGGFQHIDRNTARICASSACLTSALFGFTVGCQCVEDEARKSIEDGRYDLLPFEALKKDIARCASKDDDDYGSSY